MVSQNWHSKMKINIFIGKLIYKIDTPAAKVLKQLFKKKKE